MTSRLIAYHIERLKNKNPDVRRNTINELRLLSAPEAIPAMEALFHEDEVEDIRIAAGKALLPIFYERLRHADPAVRLAAINDIRKVGDADSLKPLEDAYKAATEPDVRKAAQDAGREIYNQTRVQPRTKLS